MALSKEMQVASLLIDLEAELRILGCWDAQPPSLEALGSAEPFCIDTLELYQWLQWVFIPRIYHDLENANPLPERCKISPIVEEWIKLRRLEAGALLAVMLKIDRLLSGEAE